MFLCLSCVFFAFFLLTVVAEIDTNSPYYVGCFTDSGDRQLKEHNVKSFLNTPAFCIGVCHGKGFSLAGVEVSMECYCGKNMRDGSTKVDDRECVDPCEGNPDLKCGAPWRISVYRTAIANTGFNPAKSLYVACYEDGNNRLLTGDYLRSEALTPDYCVNFCKKKGYRLAGMEVGLECYCGNTILGAVPVPDSECDHDCSGDRSLKCGYYWRLSVYRTGIGGIGASPVRSNYVGCYIDDYDRQLTGAVNRTKGGAFLTPDRCVNFCYQKGFSFAGLEVGEECYCGDSLKPGTKVDDSECSIACPGDILLMCGSYWRLSVYRTMTIGRGFNPVQSNYVGCYSDSKFKQLNGAAKTTKLLTPDFCVNFCYDKGYHLAGLQEGMKCFCGDILKENTKVERSECNRGCAGDLSLTCGSKDRLDVYKTNIDYSPLSYYIGCFEENREDRLFSGLSFDSEHLTPDYCIGFCYRRGYMFAGTQYGEGCFCGNSLKQRDRVEFNECSIPCSGDNTQMCGGHWRISVYKTGIVLSGENSNGITKPVYVGCYKDDANRQINSARTDATTGMSQDLCASFCYRKGFRLAGLQAGEQCFCGDNLKGGTQVEDKDCNRICFANDLPMCGGAWRLSIFRTSIPDNLVHSYYIGCFEENKNVNLLNGLSREVNFMTIDTCVGLCYRRGFIYAGMKNGGTCVCGNSLQERNGIENIKCDSLCAGDKTQFCGGLQKCSIYRTGVNEPIRINRTSCEKSDSYFNGQVACKGEVLFEDDFKTGFVENLKWAYSRLMPSVPDNEFVLFGDKAKNIYVKDGMLYIKPTLSDNGNLLNGQINVKDCTGEPGGVECYRQAVYYFILPPLESARIHTKEKFSFRFGKVQIRAKMPVGDWIVPEVWLLPKDNSYGPYYTSGKIRLAMARGNKDLKMGSEDLGNSNLESGILMGPVDDVHGRTVHWQESEGWSDSFHNFTLIWTPDNLSFAVDDSPPVHIITEKGRRISDLIDFNTRPPKTWDRGTVIAPFDKEFYVSLGLSVGGTRDFPNESVSGQRKKPWQDSDAKAMLHFWQAKDDWYDTWNGEKSALQIDYIKVTAL